MNSALVLERLAALAMSAIVLAGCAYTHPYVLPAPMVRQCGYQDKVEPCHSFPGTVNAIKSVDTYADAVRDDLTGNGGVTTINRWLGLGTFAMVTALAVNAAHTAPASATKNLALGAGAAYTGSTLFAPTSSESLYLTAHASLICIGGKGDRFLAAYWTAKKQLESADKETADDDQTSVIAVISNPQCVTPDNTKDPRIIALNARDAANAALERAQALDGTMAQSLMSASNGVLTEMNRQLLLQSPSPDAIAKAGKSASTIASGLLVPIGAPDSGQKIMKLCPAIAPAKLQEMTSLYNSVKDSVVQELNSIGDLSSGCLAAPAIALSPLAVNQSDVELAPGKSANLVVTGGRPLYTAAWTGDVPDAQTELSMQPIDATGHLLITEHAAAKAKSYKIQITDSAAVPTALIVTINVNPAPAVAPAAPAGH